MSEADRLIEDIDKLRSNLEKMIVYKKGNIQDNEVQEASKKLNEAINQYNKMLEEKMAKK